MREQIPCLRILPDNNHVAIQQRCGYMPANFQRIAVRFVEVDHIQFPIRQVTAASQQRERPPAGLAGQKLGVGRHPRRKATCHPSRSPLRFHGVHDHALERNHSRRIGGPAKW